MIRCQAIGLLEDALHRYTPPTVAFDSSSLAADIDARIAEIDNDAPHPPPLK